MRRRQSTPHVVDGQQHPRHDRYPPGRARRHFRYAQPLADLGLITSASLGALCSRSHRRRPTFQRRTRGSCHWYENYIRNRGGSDRRRDRHTTSQHGV